MDTHHTVIEKVCRALSEDGIERGRAILTDEYPFIFQKATDREYRDSEKLRIFLRDGFIDRYSGQRLVFPPVLRILSKEFPREFPYQAHWKMSECHVAYWQLAPTIDHIVPVTRGGLDEESNWVSTSQLRNNAKANWLLEELGWNLAPPGDLGEWDGLFAWFLGYIADNPALLKDKYISTWHRVAMQFT